MKRFNGAAGDDYELFEKACPHFEELENTLGKTLQEHFKKIDIDEIKVLEIGCGPGFTSLIILEADDRTNVTAIDNEPVMLAQAKDILQRYIKNKKIELIQADALGFLKKQASYTFDVFASGFTLHNFTKKYRKEVLKEIYRVLKNGGIFVNADKYALDNKVEHTKTLDWQLAQFQKVYTKLKRSDLRQEWTTHYLEDNKAEIIMKESASKVSMEKSGFKNIKTVFRKKMEAVIFAQK
ncbi:MAG: methyltransferase domain-containing protein [Candidatus Gracilibacteria bacterium]|nr:methyltransferase domain-containing protein [Candidatus Gracilibacteria bacterium]